MPPMPPSPEDSAPRPARRAPAIAPSGIDRAHWRVIILSSLGGALEFYDFVVYSTFALYIGNTFFPARDPLTSLLLSFVVFAAGYVARPLGGVVFSHFGDRYGRRRVFILAMLIMSSATVAMGLLPGYAAWGAAASVCMVLLRLLQGFCLGGELPGAITYVVETAPRSAGFAAGFIFFCVNTGVAVASGLSLLLHATLAPAQVADWGWRIGFLVGGALGLVSFWLRLSLEETAEFQKIRHTAARRPFAELMRTSPGAVIVAVAAMTATAGFNGLLFAMPAFMPRFMHYSSLVAIEAQNCALLPLSFGLLAAAWLGDFIPRRRILATGAVLLALLSIPFFNALADRSVGPIALFLGAGIVASLVNGPMTGVVADVFATRIRFSGVAVSFNLAFSVFSGTAPLLATLLAKTFTPTTPAYLMLGCALVTLASTLVLKRYEGRILGTAAESAAIAETPSEKLA
jgi:MFS transporter, MHS family, proline/betaine transporter